MEKETRRIARIYALVDAQNDIRYVGSTGMDIRERASIHHRHRNSDTDRGNPELNAWLRSLERPPAAILLLSDGKSTRGRNPIEAARDARRQKVPVYTVALGTPNGTIEVPHPSGRGTLSREVPPDPAALREIAQITGGRTFTATAADELDAIYERLGSQVSHKDEKREVTAAFAGGALLLIGFGALLSLRWFGRLP